MEFERETVEILDGSKEELLVIPLSGGRTMYAREVPIHLWADIHAANPRPEEPVDEVETAAGTTELVRPKPDDVRWIRYYIEIDEYTDKISRIIQRVRWYYAFKGIVEVPEDWEVPEIFQLSGVETATDKIDRLVQYVRYEILRTKSDKETLDAAVSGIVPESEREASRALFRESPE